MPRTAAVVLGLAFLVLALAPVAAQACNCSTGGACHCGADCACGMTAAGGTTTSMTDGMTTPTDQIIAIAAATPQTVHVDLNAFSFSANVTINAGDTVQWDWKAGFHNVTSVFGSPEAFASPTQSAGAFTHTFNTPGTFWYYCSIHGSDNLDGTASGMAATVTVVAVPEPTSLSALATGAAPLLTLRRRRHPLR